MALKRRELPELLAEELRWSDEDDIYAAVTQRLPQDAGEDVSPRIEVFDDADTLARAVAGELLARLGAAQAGGGSPQVALTGGSIAERVHAALGGSGPDSGVDWARVVVWWGDERFVASDSPDRNAGDARPVLRRPGRGSPADHVHEVPASDAVASVDEAAAAYGRTKQGARLGCLRAG